MFDIGFSEIVVIFVLALIVLGPEKLPKVVREVGRWVGRARAMARQFQEQLEEEVDLERPRTIRPEPVRAVGGVPAADSSSLTAEQAEPTQTEAAPSLAAGGPEYVEPTLETATLAPSEQPDSLETEGVAPLNPGTHERAP
ncbi:MAG: Sec-independent protein translocase protein TatB [Steroidobacteraceae bacterium]